MTVTTKTTQSNSCLLKCSDPKHIKESVDVEIHHEKYGRDFINNSRNALVRSQLIAHRIVAVNANKWRQEQQVGHQYGDNVTTSFRLTISLMLVLVVPSSRSCIQIVQMRVNLLAT